MVAFDDEMMESGNRTYLDMRSGWLAETRTIPVDNIDGQPIKREYQPWLDKGYILDYNENKNGDRTYYVARKRRSVSGFVTNLFWYKTELKDRGVTLTGWKITVEQPDKVFVIQIDSSDRVFGSLMGSLLNVDFNDTVRFRGYKKDGKKNLLLYQGESEDAKDFIRGLYRMRFMARLTKQKLEQNQPLTDQERENVAYNADGSVNWAYPYITQNLQDKWNFDAWNDFLIQKMRSEVIPAIQVANEARGADWKRRYLPGFDDLSSSGDEPDIADQFAPPMSAQAPVSVPESQKQHPGELPPTDPLELAAMHQKTAPKPNPTVPSTYAAGADDDIPF